MVTINPNITAEDDEIITDWFIDAHNMPGSKVQFDGGLGADPKLVCNWMDFRIVANGKVFSVLITGYVEEEDPMPDDSDLGPDIPYVSGPNLSSVFRRKDGS